MPFKRHLSSQLTEVRLKVLLSFLIILQELSRPLTNQGGRIFSYPVRLFIHPNLE